MNKQLLNHAICRRCKKSKDNRSGSVISVAIINHAVIKGIVICSGTSWIFPHDLEDVPEWCPHVTEHIMSRRGLLRVMWDTVRKKLFDRPNHFPVSLHDAMLKCRDFRPSETGAISISTRQPDGRITLE